MSMLGKAIAIVAEAFKNKTDKAGEPYILHCLTVMNDLHSDDDELNCQAVMHDLFEDCSEQWNVAKLLAEGFSNRVVMGVFHLTHDKTISYEDYIKTISGYPDAVKIKLSDLRHNSNITRLKGLTKKDFDRMEKYHKAYTYLSKN